MNNVAYIVYFSHSQDDGYNESQISFVTLNKNLAISFCEENNKNADWHQRCQGKYYYDTVDLRNE